MDLSNFRTTTLVIGGPKPVPDNTKPPRPPSNPVPGHKGRGAQSLSRIARFFGLPARPRRKGAISEARPAAAQVDPAARGPIAQRREPIIRPAPKPAPLAVQLSDADQDEADCHRGSLARSARQREKDRIRKIVDHGSAIGLVPAALSVALNSNMPRGQAVRLLSSLLAADPQQGSNVSDIDAMVRKALANASAAARR